MSKIKHLLKKHHHRDNVFESHLLSFKGCKGYDVYNISQPFQYKEKIYLFGRVEKPTSEISQVVLFKKIGQYTYQKTEFVISDFQDPAISMIDEDFILGGTKIYHQDNQITSWSTAFYKGKKIEDLKFFFESPKKMKDVRLFKHDVIHTFTRPQGSEAKLGKIGYCQFNRLSELNQNTIDEAPLLKNNFEDDEWGGVNQVHLLKNNLLGVLGHISKMSKGNVRHYYAMTFCFDPKKMKISGLKIICERQDFPKAKSKRPDLEDVIFPGGIVRLGNGSAEIYAGLSDAKAGVALIEDPFIEYEKL